MSNVDNDKSTEDQDSAENSTDQRLDDQLRRLYEYVLDEPIPKRLLDALKKESKDEDPPDDKDNSS